MKAIRAIVQQSSDVSGVRDVYAANDVSVPGILSSDTTDRPGGVSGHPRPWYWSVS